MADFPAVIDLSTLDGTDGFRLDGVEADDESGYSVSSAGDVNGDGFDDIIIGAFFGGGSAFGASYVVFGKASGFTGGFDLASLDGSNGFRLEGLDSFDFSGGSVSSAGDVNGDGFDDVVVGASGGDPNGVSGAGESYVVFGKASGFVAGFDLTSLDGSNGFRLDGIDVNDSSGGSVSSAGDVNGDGFDDVLIGAANGDPGGDSLAGESYVVFGKASGFTATFDLASLDGSNGFRLDGIDPSDFSGSTVSSAGDVNGDGFDDILIAAVNGDPGGDSAAGESYVVFGKASGFVTGFDLASLDGSNGFRLDGIDVDDLSGRSVSSAGDVNGDGFDDILIGAINGDPGGVSSAGESYVVFGKASGFAAAIDLASLDGSDGFRLDGIDSGDHSGGFVSSAGDVNGDGFYDILIGADLANASGTTSAGESYVVFGKASGFAATFDLASLDGSNGFRLDGIDLGDRSGGSVSSAGDVNGDGFDDVVIGAHYGDPGGDSDAGESYVVFGIGPTTAVTRVGAAADQTIFGGAFDDDIRGRAGDDLLIGADGADLLRGDNGDDVLDGGAGADMANGGNGDDRFVQFNDGFLNTLDGGADTDELDLSTSTLGWTVSLVAGAGSAGATTLALSNIENITGSDFVDSLTGDGQANFLDGGAEGDTLSGGNGDDELEGGLGDDSIDGGNGSDTATFQSAASGVEVYLLYTGIETGVGIDTLISIENLTGSDFDDRLVGDAGDNVLIGSDGADIIKGKGGNDTFVGGEGDDKLTGAEGDDTMFGGVGNDILYALAGLDTLNGGADDDFLYGGRDADTLNGDAGNDNMRGNLGNDIMNGGTGIDEMRGGGSNDTLDGGADNDFLYGENGTDTLIGGVGDDALSGGFGGGLGGDGFTDTFVYTDTAGGAGGFDRIKDFENGIDVMDLSSFGFTDFTADVLSLATDTGTGLRIDFGGGDVLFVEGFLLADFDAGDVLI